MNTEYKIFNDRFFDKARKYVKNEITQEEVDLYSLGKIRKIYGSFEELLLDNIEYYSRIIRTILWLYENTLVNDGKIITKVDKVKYNVPMTATKFYYICLTQIDSSRDEIIYGFPQIRNAQGNTFEELFKPLLQIGSFSFNVTFSIEHTQSKTYQKAFELDTTNNDYISQVVVNSKFIYIDRTILSADIRNAIRLHELTYYNYTDLQGYETDENILDSRPNGISYLGPGYAEEINFATNCDIIRKQIGNKKQLIDFDIFYSRKQDEIFCSLDEINNCLKNVDNLKIVCSSMIQNYRRRFKAMRLHHDQRCYSIITIRKFWNNHHINESCYLDNKLLYKKQFNVGKLNKLVSFIINNGYFLYTINSIEDDISISKMDDPEEILNHYTEYINRTFVDSTLRLELIEQETEKIISAMTKYTLIDEQ